MCVDSQFRSQISYLNLKLTLSSLLSWVEGVCGHSRYQSTDQNLLMSKFLKLNTRKITWQNH